MQETGNFVRIPKYKGYGVPYGKHASPCSKIQFNKNPPGVFALTL